MKKNDSGTILIFNIKKKSDSSALDLTNATVTLLINLNGVVTEYDCNIDDDEGGIVSYEVQSGDIDESGVVEMQCKITTTGGEWSTNKVKMVVGNVLEESV